MLFDAVLSQLDKLPYCHIMKVMFVFCCQPRTNARIDQTDDKNAYYV